MTEDFNLSDHIDEADDGMSSYIDFYAVKEFIRQLKNELKKRKLAVDIEMVDGRVVVVPLQFINEQIDKLAGDKLIK